MCSKKMVYVPMVADFLHPGHLNILRVASELGEVTVGLFSDEAVASYKRLPFMSYEQRKTVVETIKYVDRVVAQQTKDYEPNLRAYKPDYMVHGTDWQRGPLAQVRARAIEVMAEWGGVIIEPEYTAGISSTDIQKHEKALGVMPERRLSSFKQLLEARGFVRACEAHNGISAMVVENAEHTAHNQQKNMFDALWLSSLTDSTAKGKPDIEFVDLTSRMFTVNDILEVTTKPIIYDGDTGSKSEHFAFTVRRLERLGVSCVIIEDKIGLKRNSLHDTDEEIHVQDSVENFSAKIHAGKVAQMTRDFMVFARIESLILNKGLGDALMRAAAYIDAGADGIMIHSRQDDGREILDFCREYNKFAARRWLVAVPTNYAAVTEDTLREAGINVVIYANQLLRSSYTAMKSTAELILKHGRAVEADRKYIPALDLVRLIPGN